MLGARSEVAFMILSQKTPFHEYATAFYMLGATF